MVNFDPHQQLRIRFRGGARTTIETSRWRVESFKLAQDRDSINNRIECILQWAGADSLGRLAALFCELTMAKMPATATTISPT